MSMFKSVYMKQVMFLFSIVIIFALIVAVRGSSTMDGFIPRQSAPRIYGPTVNLKRGTPANIVPTEALTAGMSTDPAIRAKQMRSLQRTMTIMKMPSRKMN